MNTRDVPLSEQAFIARTPDDAVLVRVAVKGCILGVQLEPKAMRYNMNELAQRIMACADVAYLQGQVALREQMEQAELDPVCYADFPTERDLAAARDRLRML
ncbi:DUF2694 family protein [Mycobacterium lehmannii]|uniref:DUF2694 family protein n=1 Tax=Mycobacterium lehmannii TaxID=2048550 RepID=UPI000B945C42|nr:DUF2694 family protein [Mycobacterium lehmannii]